LVGKNAKGGNCGGVRQAGGMKKKSPPKRKRQGIAIKELSYEKYRAAARVELLLRTSTRRWDIFDSPTTGGAAREEHLS